MTGSRGDREQREMHRAVRLRERRKAQGKEEGERSIWQNLSMIGALGWLIVTPIVIGVFLGRWLVRTFDTGIFFSGALIFLGASIGSYLAWQRVHKESDL